MSRRQAIIGHLQLFGKILLKQFNQTYSHIQQQHPHSHPSSSSHSSSNSVSSSSLETTTGSRVVAVTTAASIDTGPRPGSGDSHQKQETQIFLPFIFPAIPSFIETSRSPALALSSQRQQAAHAQLQHLQTKLDRLPLVSTTMGLRPSILPLSSIHHLISSIVFSSSSSSSSTSTTTSMTTTAPTIATTTVTTTLLQGLVLNFRSPSHHQGFFILLPDMDQDLVLDLTPLIHSLYGDPDHIPDEEQDIDAFLTIVLFEEDEVPKKSWTLLIPRPGVKFAKELE
ncbi:MAG: hypothetical protein J3R72DRAFT_489189 [Linnemannia gamsii]|nr:MAG: hypothetical protein J3R72DRAFT_489189 [Linnemannia gamsii]